MQELVNPRKKENESRRRIVGAALLLFSKKGFGGTGVRELAAEADVNVAMVNYFFGSKKGLLKELLDTFFSGYLSIARETLSGTGSVEPRLRRFIAATLVYFESNRHALLIALAEIPRDDPEIIEHKTQWARQMMDEINRKVCQPLSLEQGRSVSPKILGPLLTATLASRFLFAPILDQINPGQTSSLDPATTEQLVNLLLYGLLPTPE